MNFLTVCARVASGLDRLRQQYRPGFSASGIEGGSRLWKRLCFTCGLAVCAAGLELRATPVEKVADALEVSPVWAGHAVGFALLTQGTNQYVAFYDANRRMTVGGRSLQDRTWKFQTLPSQLGWDSHNYVTLALDTQACLHVSGNMHVNPLVYFRGSRAHDVTSLARVPAMVGEREGRVTYPRFLQGANGELIFTYRDGSSGNGDQILNIYDPAAANWQRLLKSPLFGGQGQMNAYYTGPVKGPDGFFHICWVWRDTPDCSSNHDLSYARSRDMVQWEKSNGQPLRLPITLASGEIVDRVPVRGGLINGNSQVGFDAQGRPIVSYHKHDPRGNTQAYCARLEEGRWQVYQVSDWAYRWNFSGGGTIVFEIGIGPVECDASGQLTLNYSHAKYGSGTWVLDPATLKPSQQAGPADPLGEYAKTVAGTFRGLQRRSAADLGHSDEPGVRYQLLWESLPTNRDQPHTGPLPPPSMLRLLKIVKESPPEGKTGA